MSFLAARGSMWAENLMPPRLAAAWGAPSPDRRGPPAGRGGEPVHVPREPVRVQAGIRPRLVLVPPVAQQDEVLGRSGGAAALVDPEDIGVGSVAPRDEVLHADIAQLIDNAGEQGQVLDALDVRARIEGQRFGPPQPVRRARLGSEVPLHRGADELLRVRLRGNRKIENISGHFGTSMD